MNLAAVRASLYFWAFTRAVKDTDGGGIETYDFPAL